MSLKKGYTYDNIKEFCEKYDCSLLATKDEIELRPSEFDITSSCGHVSTTSFHKLFKRKHGVYCDNCFNNMDEAKCFGCGNMFEHSETLFVYCSVQCSHSRKATEEHIQNVRDTFYKKFGHIDENGNLLNVDDVKKLNMKKGEMKRRDIGMEEKKRYTYDMIKELYLNENCELLTSEEEFNNNKSCRNFKIKGKCGHVIEHSNFYSFFYTKQGINCSDCTNKNTALLMKNKCEIEGSSMNMIIEKNGVDLIREKCKDKFIVKKMREACKADILVKPINEESDTWLPIQLKISSKKYIKHCINLYSFTTGGKDKQYHNMLLLLVCLEDSKFWIFDSNSVHVKLLNKITIGNKKSKYDDMRIDDLNDTFNYWYNKNLYNITFETGNTPHNKTAQLEYEYVKLREEKISFLDFVNNEIDGLVFDFKIDDHKIQEKVCTLYKNTYVTRLCKNGGRINKIDNSKSIQTKIPYCENDNDFYWFNLPDRNTFYVVPEIELIDRDFIATKDNKGKTNITISANEHWLNCYKFYYDTIDEAVNKEELLLILNAM